MSATRRILVAGLPAAAALALAGSPALAMQHHPVHPAVTASPCAAADRTKCDYSATGAGTITGTATTPAGGQHTRGHGGYGTTPATPTPAGTTPNTTHPTSPAPNATTPTAHVATVPTTSPASPTSPAVQGATPSPSASTPGGGVSAGHALPVTGAPMGAIVAVGGLMVAGGVASVWYTRRRRTV